ncbi:hypothetical protein D3C80_1960530 [compost metagenome]
MDEPFDHRPRKLDGELPRLGIPDVAVQVCPAVAQHHLDEGRGNVLEEANALESNDDGHIRRSRQLEQGYLALVHE